MMWQLKLLVCAKRSVTAFLISCEGRSSDESFGEQELQQDYTISSLGRGRKEEEKVGGRK